MPHIHTEPGQHDHTVSIYLFRTDFDKPKIMLHFHQKIGAYAQFGGHIELHESPWQALIHELKEETGYDIGQLQILQPPYKRLTNIASSIVHPHPITHNSIGYPGENRHFHIDSAYAVIANEAPRDTPHEGESTDIRLFTREELITHGKDIINDVTYDIALYTFDEILTQWKAIPTSEFK